MNFPGHIYQDSRFGNGTWPGHPSRTRHSSFACRAEASRRRIIRHLPVILFLLFLNSLHAATDAATNSPPPVTARDFYNAGTRLLAARKFTDAERMFQSALAAQDDRVQPVALYNVGHTRFEAGLDRLKQGPDAQKASNQGSAALADGQRAISQAEAALAENNLNQMIDAYLAGRGARHDLREAEKAVSAAMEIFGKTLEQWRRADDDFKGAAELNPADTNATHNAEAVERDIARLIDSVRKMQEMMAAMGQQRKDLGKLLSKLKGQIPAPNAPPGPAGEDDDDDQQGTTPESLTGQKEGATRQGDEMPVSLSPDQASQILNGLSIDGTRRLLEMSDKEGTPPKDRKGRNW